MANSLIRFDPVRDIARFDPFRNIEEALRDWGATAGWRGSELPGGIRMDVRETDQQYEVDADLPGVQKADIRVTVAGNVVSIGSECAQDSAGGGNHLCRERCSGRQQRSFTLPQEVDPAGSQAHYDNGVLHLTLPKLVDAEQHNLTIQ